MDFALSSDQELIKQSVRRFLENECPKDRVRELAAEDRPYDPELWRKMVDLGWMGLALPEEYGGTGGGIVDLAIVVEEMGRSLAPTPFFATVAACSLPLLAFGSPEQKARYLPEIANGETLWSLAWLEASGGFGSAGVGLRAVGKGGRYTLEGTKLFVPYAAAADRFLVLARTGPGATVEEGLTVFVVDARAPGVSARAIPTIAQDRQCEVSFDGVEVGETDALGGVGRGWEIAEFVLQRSGVLAAAEMLGGAQSALEMTIEYAKERIQFGQTIGSYQAVQHNLVDLRTEIEGLRHLVYQAAWHFDASTPSPLLASAAKAKANEVYQRACIDGVKLHGAIGFTEELDLGLYHRRTLALRNAFGATDFHRERVAAGLLERARRSELGL